MDISRFFILVDVFASALMIAINKINLCYTQGGIAFAWCSSEVCNLYCKATFAHGGFWQPGTKLPIFRIGFKKRIRGLIPSANRASLSSHSASSSESSSQNLLQISEVLFLVAKNRYVQTQPDYSTSNLFFSCLTPTADSKGYFNFKISFLQTN